MGVGGSCRDVGMFICGNLLHAFKTALTGRSRYLTGRFAPGTGGSSHPVARQLPLVRIVRS